MSEMEQKARERVEAAEVESYRLKGTEIRHIHYCSPPSLSTSEMPSSPFAAFSYYISFILSGKGT